VSQEFVGVLDVQMWRMNRRPAMACEFASLDYGGLADLSRWALRPAPRRDRGQASSLSSMFARQETNMPGRELSL